MRRWKEAAGQSPETGPESSGSKKPKGWLSEWRHRHDKNNNEPAETRQADKPRSGNPARASLSLWDRAYESLKEQDGPIIEKYEKLLSREFTRGRSQDAHVPTSDVETKHWSSGVASKDDTDRLTEISDSAPTADFDKALDGVENDFTNVSLDTRQQQLNVIIKSGLARMESETRLRSHLEKTGEVIQPLKGWIDAAVQVSPQASIAWAAICLALPLLTQPVTAGKINRDGFAYVTSRMEYYVALEKSMHSSFNSNRSAAMSDGLKTQYEAQVIDLYQQILNFQVRSVLRFYRNVWRTIGRDMLQLDGWQEWLNAVQESERTLNTKIDQINTLESRGHLQNLSQTADAQYKSMQYTLGLFEEQVDVSRKILNAIEVQNDRQISAEERECLQLFRLAEEPGEQSYEWYKDRIPQRVDKTCLWFLNHNNFVEWRAQDSGPLLVTADPGCGKSVLAKYLIDCELREDFSVVCYFFFKDQVQQNLYQALCALIHQLLSRNSSLIQYALHYYRQDGKGLVRNVKALWEILHKAAYAFDSGRILFVLDALDECCRTGFEDLQRMLKAELYSREARTARIKYLFTCRPYESRTSGFEELVEFFPSIRIPGEEESDAISQEIEYVITFQVKKIARDRKLQPDIKDHLERRLLNIPHRTYLWIYLVFDYLRTEVFRKTKTGVNQPIDTLPQSINEAYEKLLERSKDQGTLRKTLCIMLAATRPLTLREMNIAVNMNDISLPTSHKDLDLELDNDFKTRLREQCGLFITLNADGIHFLHQTAQEFLLSKLRLPLPSKLQLARKWQDSIEISEAHFVLAKICITYLHFDDLCKDDRLSQARASMRSVEDISTVRFRGQVLDEDEMACIWDTHPLLQYSAANWSHHLRLSTIQEQKSILHPARNLCTRRSEQHDTWIFSSCFSDVGEMYSLLKAPEVSLASAIGVDILVDYFLDSGADINEMGPSCGYGNWAGSALTQAVRKINLSIVKRLLERDSDVNRSIGEEFPLKAAVYRNDLELINLLLQHGADVNKCGDNKGTALMLAAELGYEDCLNTLLAAGADDSARNISNNMALHIAVNRNDLRMYEILSEHRKKQGDWDIGKYTLLHTAVRGRNFEFLRFFLHQGAEVDARDDHGRTPLTVAAHCSEQSVDTLLKAGAEVDARNDIGWTPLYHAVIGWNIDIAKILLNAGANTEARDNFGTTPPILVSQSFMFHEVRFLSKAVKMMQLLLEAGANLDARDNDGRTPLITAVSAGNPWAVETLLNAKAGRAPKNVKEDPKVAWYDRDTDEIDLEADIWDLDEDEIDRDADKIDPAKAMNQFKALLQSNAAYLNDIEKDYLRIEQMLEL